VLDTALLAPGRYEVEVNGAATGRTLFIVPVMRPTAGALADEAHPAPPSGSSDSEKQAEGRIRGCASWGWARRWMR
jgi:hypothetical protein